MKKQNKVLLCVLIIILIIIFTPIFGGMYEKFFGPACTSFLCPAHPEYLDGFFISYMFFVSLIVTFFGGIKKYKILLISLGILLAIDLFLGAWEGLIINLGVAIAGWLLAQGGLLVYKKLNKEAR